MFDTDTIGEAAELDGERTEIGLVMARLRGSVSFGFSGVQTMNMSRDDQQRVMAYLEDHVDKRRAGQSDGGSSESIGVCVVDGDGEVVSVEVGEEWLKPSEQ